MIFQDAPVAAVVVGVLSPECQMQREIAAIKNDPQLVEKLGNQVVQEVRKVDGGYVVFTDLCELTVSVIYLPPAESDPIGKPVRFEMTFNDPVWYQ